MFDCVVSILGLGANNKMVLGNCVQQENLNQVRLARDNEIDLYRLVVVLFDVEVLSYKARMRQKLVATVAAATTAGIKEKISSGKACYNLSS